MAEPPLSLEFLPNGREILG